MTHKSTESAAKRKAANGKPLKPYPDNTQFPHAWGRWAKRIMRTRMSDLFHQLQITPQVWLAHVIQNNTQPLG